MVLTNHTIEAINYAKDIDYDFNIKILLIAILIVSSISSIWYSRKMIIETTKDELTYKFLLMYGVLGLFHIPFSFLLLKRDISLDFIINLMFELYTISVYLIGAFVLWWLAEKFLFKIFGLKFGSSKKDNRRTSDYRRSD